MIEVVLNIRSFEIADGREPKVNTFYLFNEIDAWLLEYNINGIRGVNGKLARVIYTFDNKIDAMAFKLRWL